MSTRVIERVDEWEERRFSGGYGALQDLAAEEFSGVVRVGGAELYMTKGAAVGIRNGDIDDFEGADGTAHEAPTPALPLLAVMQERSDEARAQYYSEDTGIREVDSKLESGGFTGYIELSENVLSGDYYVVYHQGRSMSVAFVGNAEQLLEGDEAFERADGEVGIYKVYPADIEPVEIPEPAEPDETPTGGSADPPESDTEAETDAETTADDDQAGQSEGAPDREDETAGAESGTAGGTSDDRGTSEDGPDRERDEPARQDPSPQSTGPPDARRAPEPDATRTGADSGRRSDPLDPDRGTRAAGSSQANSRSSRALETRAVPSLDPGRSQTEDTSVTTSQPEPATRQSEPARQSQRRQSREGATPQARTTTTAPADEPTAERDSPEEREADDDSAETVDTERIEELEAELDDREDEIERLESELESARNDRDRVEEELEGLREERDELEAEVERLQSELDRLETELGAATDRERRITPKEALDGTDIFVRYHSKGDATLEKAHDGGTRKEDVIGNIRLEKHTQFDADSVAVGGQTYEEFIEETTIYQFVEWVAKELLFEVRDTGHEKALATLFDALPKIDRAELNGTIDVVYSDDGQETRSTESFGVVLRDRMGDPLLVANLNDSREGTTESMMERLITSAERVGQTSDEFAAAFFVTESFFEPGALETASDATQGGLFSRSKQKSFVNLSRKRGYHLCLVEARSENFNLTVPEL